MYNKTNTNLYVPGLRFEPLKIKDIRSNFPMPMKLPGNNRTSVGARRGRPSAKDLLYIGGPLGSGASRAVHGAASIIIYA